MNEKNLPQSISVDLQEPVYFPRKEEICRRLDEFYKASGIKKDTPPSSMFLGALYAMQKFNQNNNPDWMSQVAHSLREIFYELGLASTLKDYGSTQGEVIGAQMVGRYKNFITDIAHHNLDKAERSTLIGGSNIKPVKLTPKVFESVIYQFGEIIFAVLRRQIDTHNEIDEILRGNPITTKSNSIKELICLNPDARQYFFFKADEQWLEWLWKNGFLDKIKEKALDPNSYGFRMPELHYLVNVAEKDPDIVTDIICSFEISKNNFNPEVIDQFTRIASKLPAKCLKKIVKKIRDEKWVKLMGRYTQYGFEYADMFETLYKAGDFESILTLAEAILLIRSRKEIKERKISYRGDDVFYIHDLSETKVFNFLVDVPEKHQEIALSIAIRAFIEAIEDEGNYLLMDEDFFTLDLNAVEGHHYREELKALTATVIELVKRLFSTKSVDTKKIFEKYFTGLPLNQTSRRLKLFVLSQDPKTFANELKSEYFRLFETKKITEILYGAEYERSLKAGFSFLADTEKREYIKRVIELFSNFEKDEDKRWKRHYASSILSTISEYLTEDELTLSKNNEFKIDPKYQPEPSIGRIRGGTVTPRSPINLAEFPVEEVAEKLKGELAPEELQKEYKNDDFLSPRDATGVAENLRGDIKNRIVEYLDNAALFFDRDRMTAHYTNAFLWGVKDALSESQGELDKTNYDELFKLLIAIKESGEKKSFSKRAGETEDRWLSNWESVHSTIADLVEELIRQRDQKNLLNFKVYRKRIFQILEYLFSFDDPIPEDEKLKTARSTVKHPSDSEYSISDPFSIAINSVRGRAFQALLHFIYQDASNFESIKLADDIKALYSRLLKEEKTRAISFMFGHYLPSFYFRDRDWTRGIFKEIFEPEKKDKYLRLAVWEGYLSSNLYQELFFEPYIQSLYDKNITLVQVYPKQKFFKDPHESLAIHLALAFVHYEEFDFDNALFKKFITNASTRQLSEFISFLGKSYIGGENTSILKDEKSPWRIMRLKDFWNFMLDTRGDSPALEEFGSWIDAESDVFDIEWLAEKVARTLEATKGKLEWDYGLLKSIEKLAAESPKNTLRMLEKHFLSSVEDQRNFLPLQSDREWYRAFELLYNNKTVKVDTYNLINKLIEKGGRQFWNLEDIVKSKPNTN
jgi:hypothetical protein